MSLECQCNVKECIGGIVYCFKTTELLFTGPSTTFVPLSLRKCHFRSKQKKFGTEDVVMQYYENEEKENVEAIYAVPIATKADAILFEAEIGGKRICKVVKETEKFYKYAIKDIGNLILKDEHKSVIFKMALGKLEPGSGVRVELKYLFKSPVPELPHCEYPSHIKPQSDSSILYGDFNQTTYEEEDLPVEYEMDDDGLIPWNERPWGETGRIWGDFGRPWGVITRPWGQYPFK